MGGGSVLVGKEAYLVAIMHSLKFPGASVNGVLLGTADMQGDSLTVRVCEAVPLLHSHMSLAPALDAGFALVDEYCKTTGLGVVGYYHANAHQAHNLFAGLLKKIADRVADTVRDSGKKWMNAVCMMVDNVALDDLASVLSEGIALSDMGLHTGVVVMQKVGDRWGDADGLEIAGCKEGSTQAELRDMIAKLKHQEVIDFDDHLNDVAKGWLPPLLKGKGAEKKGGESYP
mmetsp:Transcript_46661/g.113622  ORF Transcript_46661/g.113622 Transcript_46661/m.113622 type:complete len:230 (+) Transcript_46661:21-710(+)|eukprot:CAMPEP_0206229442 /NCGR_PEP_ID=MMETSP0047_2-20121206/9708_1 /ASSEMBLY_ACC=CAM_ASM_000192 /TAXON_ID=195065 /ORGANISM="Chroomonas mesostigmatica_cf, Strain CCMP1168" /LENGTH=229 /DNA_ID=CAMNT_0053652759 /DNA_START=1 /DNA_END=690 /DNA_ORIENTATION=+